jgi:hypothetical protein
MARTKPAGLNPFTVICQSHLGADACDQWQIVAVALNVAGYARERGKRGLPVVALEAHGESKRQPRLCFRAIRSFVFLTAQNSTWWNTTTPLPSAHTSFLTATGLERNAAFTPLHRRLGGGCCLKAEPQHHRQAKQPEGCASDAARGVEAFERQFGYPDKHQRPDRFELRRPPPRPGLHH